MHTKDQICDNFTKPHNRWIALIIDALLCKSLWKKNIWKMIDIMGITGMACKWRYLQMANIKYVFQNIHKERIS